MKSPTTIVSCFYPLKENKRHTLEEYYEWVKNFLIYANNPIVMFCDDETYDWLLNIRTTAGLLDRFALIKKPLSELEFSTPDWKEFWDSQCECGPWKGEPYQTMYQIWANKCFFIRDALEKNPFESDYFVWCDAGCWRNPIINRNLAKNWPSTTLFEPSRLLMLLLEKNGDIHSELATAGIHTHEECVTKIIPVGKLYVSGTILAGDKQAWEIFTPLFKKTLEYYAKHKMFAGDDQNILASTYIWMCKTMPHYAPKILFDPITDMLNKGMAILCENTLLSERFYQLQVVLSHEFTNCFQ
jgi:hypothetical protein